MKNRLLQFLHPRIVTEDFDGKDREFETLGLKLQQEVSTFFGRSLAIRVLDSGSDNATEIELNNLSTPYYDIERFGITFVASPRHADVLIVTGAITHNMEIAAKKTYAAMPGPKFVVAVGDDACGVGIFQGTYAVNGGADRLFTVDLRIPGNPPSPVEIMRGLLGLMAAIKTGRNEKR
jgi:Ni,Fe-hydrogenase III small subunit